MPAENRENLFNQNQTDTEIVKCSGCGSNMVFNPDTQTLYCNHCGNKLNFDTNSMATEQDLNEGLRAAPKFSMEEAAVFECDNCGAKVVLEGGQSSADCPFCGTSHVRKTDELAGIKPNAVIPFAFNEQKALLLTKTWAKKRFYAPRAFKKNLKTENLKGVYTPCFTFDSSTCSFYHGRIGKTHTRVVGSGKNRRTQTYVVWRNISGVFNHRFDDVLITAGTKFDQTSLNSISPFDTNGSKEFEENYLLGYLSYHYDKELVDCWEQAKTVMDQNLKQLILNGYSYDKVAYLNLSTTHADLTYKYVMLPVYVGNFNYKKKLYNFYVNGSTGRVNGKTPKSVLKILATVLIAAAFVVGAILAINLLGG